jgi:DNA-binding protein HU-beta
MSSVLRGTTIVLGGLVPNKAQFVEMLAERLDGDRKRAAAALDAVIDSVYAAIARGEKVAISGFGVFERRERAARTARNPATGAQVQVAASRVPAFRPGAEFRAIASGARGFTQGSTARAQAAVSSVAARVRDAADAVRDAPGKAAAAVKSGGNKAGGKKAAAKPPAAKKSTTKKSATKKAAAKSAPAKKATKKATKKSTAKASAKKEPAKKSAGKKSAKKAAKKK